MTKMFDFNKFYMNEQNSVVKKLVHKNSDLFIFNQ